MDSFKIPARLHRNPLFQRGDLPMVLLIICSLLLMIGSTVSAQERELTRQSGGLDVVLVLDASGSMLKTDPSKLRHEGAKLLLSFLSGGDRLAVIQFAGSAKVVRELQPFSQSMAGDVMKEIQEIQPLGPFSDIAEGIKLGKAVLDSHPRPDSQRVIVLLSDGRMEPDPAISPAFARTLELIHDVLPELKARETKVFTLAFSPEADRAFLAEVAASTDGLTWYTSTPEDIHKSFAELFLAIKRPQVVAQTSRGFKIDDDVEEATFYINRDPSAQLTLVSPKEEQFTAQTSPDYVKWFSGQNFDVITIKEPDPGNWRVAGTKSEEGFATVLTDLKLLTDWPLVVRAGDDPLVQARLYEDEKPVALPEMSGVINYAFQISQTDRISKPLHEAALSDDGKRGDKVALDGIFSARTVLDEPGEYRLTVVAKGPTFQRSQQIPFTVRPRLVTLEVQNVGEAEEAQSEDAGSPGDKEAGDVEAQSSQSEQSRIFSGNEEVEFKVKLAKEAVAFRSVDVQLVAINQDREKVKIPLKRSGSSSLEFSVSAGKLEGEGRYRISAVLHAETKKGEELEAQSKEIAFLFSPSKRSVVKAAPTKHHEEANPESHEERHSNAGIPWIPISLVVLPGCVAAGSLISLTKKSKERGSSTVQKYVPHKQLIDAIASMEERMSLSKVELTDPIFNVIEEQRATSGVKEEKMDPPVTADAGVPESKEADPTEGLPNDV